MHICLLFSQDSLSQQQPLNIFMENSGSQRVDLSTAKFDLIIIDLLSQMQFKTSPLLIFVCLLIFAVALKPKTFPWSKITPPTTTTSTGSYQELYFTQKVSHYNFQLTGLTWQQRYLLDLSSWSKSNKGPIVMYCGNEGPIEMFYRNAGWYNEVVIKELQGILVYPQHRYFGKSWPFGDQKTSMMPQHLGYLTTEEAMMDYVEFIKFIKKAYCSDCQVLVFGGSYAGMLAAWMRMKYPNVVDMAHAASAPIYYYRNRANFNLGSFYQIVTKNYQMHSDNCPNVIRQTFKRLLSYSTSPDAPISGLSTWFNLCKPLNTNKDIPLLMDYIDVAYSYLAMINYPYPTSFLKNVTGWPANSSCIPLDSVSPSSQDQDLFQAVRKSIEYYYSYNRTACNDIYGDSSSDQDMSGWDVLACGDQAMPMTTDGVQDMYYPNDFDYDAYTQDCWDTFKMKPDYDYTLNHFGGVTNEEYLSASRIIFTNGGLDPWSGASPRSDLSESLKACFMPNGAHHLDLRPPNSLDPPDVLLCRNFVMKTIKGWLQEIRQEKRQKEDLNLRID